MRYSGPPLEPVPVPVSVEALAQGRPLVPVWQNEAGGLTFRIGGAGGGYVKWAASGSGWDPAAEVERLRWAGRFTAVPRVRGQGADEEGAWLLTDELAGTSAVTARWRAEPAVAVRALGAGLRALHERLPVAECPFSRGAGERLERARRRGARVPAGLSQAPPVDRLVVCHGDPCAPNTLLDESGCWSGHVDMGDLGVADRWADLAVATWSAGVNYGPGWEDALLDAYGVRPDPERTDYYRRLNAVG
ncbi:phosphotransferase [Streptomyces sp. NPDC059740]|uniref:phosphotransferase n=1 Tax=Streptomyces sp. NPDC059740 TaxID=3346926 RepID=UPI0036677642